MPNRPPARQVHLQKRIAPRPQIHRVSLANLYLTKVLKEATIGFAEHSLCVYLVCFLEGIFANDTTVGPERSEAEGQ